MAFGGVGEESLKGRDGGGVDDVLREKIVDGDEAEERAGGDFGVGTVARLVELFGVSLGGKASGVSVWFGGVGREEAEEVRVTFLESDFVEETEHGDVTAEGERGKVVVEEGGFGGGFELVEKRVVEVVERLECCGGGVVGGAGGGFDDGEDVCFELVDEGGGGVEGFCAEYGFEFGARFGEGFVDGVMHGEFGVNEGAEETESGAVAVVGVQDAKLFFERIEFDTIFGAPCMN